MSAHVIYRTSFKGRENDLGFLLPGESRSYYNIPRSIRVMKRVSVIPLLAELP